MNACVYCGAPCRKKVCLAHSDLLLTERRQPRPIVDTAAPLPPGIRLVDGQPLYSAGWLNDGLNEGAGA